MKYEGKPIDTAKYKQVDIYSSSKGIYEYYAITPQNEEIRKNHNNFFLKLSKWSREQHIGEKLAEIFAKDVVSMHVMLICINQKGHIQNIGIMGQLVMLKNRNMTKSDYHK